MPTESPEHVRTLSQRLLSVHHWKARLLLWAAAAMVGVVAVLFAKTADLALAAQRWLLGEARWSVWLTAPLGCYGIAWLTRRFFRGAEGSGIPQTMFALRPGTDLAGNALLRLPVAAARIVLASLSLLCGASIGREGPTVHIGAAIMHSITRWLPRGGAPAQRRALILAGGAAGVAAAFNTPLAGVVFGIEELARSFEERASGTAMTAVMLSGVIAIALVGDYTYFGHPTVASEMHALTLGTIGVACTGGLMGGLFSRITLRCSDGLPHAVRQLQRNRPALFAGLCGVLIAAIGTLCGGLTFGSGYEEARSILIGNAHLAWYYGPARALATLLSYLSGIPAGLLAPSLSVGAGLGQWIADLSGQASAVPFAILGMCAYLAGLTQAPLTSFVIVMEMTAQHQMILPLMVTAALGSTASKLLSPPLYQTLAQRYTP